MFNLTLNSFSFAELDRYAHLRQRTVREPRGFERMKLPFLQRKLTYSLDCSIHASLGLQQEPIGVSAMQAEHECAAAVRVLQMSITEMLFFLVN